jgi:lipopolysaccharide transport system ATP-binding protein
MKDVSGEGRTVLFVSHNMASVNTLCNRGILMENGAIILDGQVDNVINAYNDSNNKAFAVGQLNDPLLRRGNGKVRIIDVKLQEDGYFDGDQILIEFLVKSNHRVGEVYASIVIKSPNNQKEFITSVPPFVISNELEADKTITVSIHLNRNNLREGIYPIYFWLGLIQKDINFTNDIEPYDVLDGLYFLKIRTKQNRLELGYDPNSGYQGYFNLEYKIEITK